MRTRTHVGLTLIAAVLGACGGGGYGGGGGGPTSPPPDGRTIAATPALTFGPSSLTVDAGDVVTFAFGSVAHNVFFDGQQAGAPADIDGANANRSVQRTFTTAGTYQYTCHIHPSMQGTVVVR